MVDDSPQAAPAPQPPPPRSRRRIVIIVVAVVLALVAVALGVWQWRRRHRGGGRPGERHACIIDERETRATFDRIVPAARGTDCTISAVETRFERIFVRLRAGQTDVPPIVIERRGCGGVPIGQTNQAIEIPPGTLARCPRAVAAMQTALGATDAH